MTDNDRPTVTLEGGNRIVPEGRSATLTLRASIPSVLRYRYPVAVSSTTMSSDEWRAPDSVTFEPGATTATITVDIVDDSET